MRPIRSPIQVTSVKKSGDFGAALNEVIKLFQELQALKQSVIETTNQKHEELSQKIDNTLVTPLGEVKKLQRQHASFVKDVTDTVTAKLQELERAFAHILTIQKGEQGLPGKDAAIDYGYILGELELMFEPKKGEKGEDAKIDHEALAEEVVKVIRDKKKLKTEHLDGWQDPEILLQRFQARSVRGGGDTVAAGTGISVTRSGGVTTVTNTGSSSTKVRDEDVGNGGSGTSFTLAHTPLANTLQLFRGGAKLRAGVGKDYTISGTSITLAIALVAGEELLGDYEY